MMPGDIAEISRVYGAMAASQRTVACGRIRIALTDPKKIRQPQVLDGLLRPQVHVDADEVAAIGDLAEIDHGAVAIGENAAHFRHGRIQRNAQ